MGETAHWVILIFGFGGLFLLFASRPKQTRALADTGVSTLGGLVDIEKGFVGGSAAA